MPRHPRGTDAAGGDTCPAIIRWTADNWQTAHDSSAKDTGLGIYVADLPTSEMPGGTVLSVALHGLAGNEGESESFTVSIEPQP